jgi:hypothetical protein
MYISRHGGKSMSVKRIGPRLWNIRARYKSNGKEYAAEKINFEGSERQAYEKEFEMRVNCLKFRSLLLTGGGLFLFGGRHV